MRIALICLWGALTWATAFGAANGGSQPSYPQYFGQKPYPSNDGDTLYFGEYAFLRCNPPIAPVVDSAPRHRNLVCDWGEETRLTHYVDSSGHADLRALTSYGDTIILGYGAGWGPSRPYRNEIISSNDFGDSWSVPENYQTPNTLGSSIDDFAYKNGMLFMIGSASRFENNRYCPFFRQKCWPNYPWIDPHYFLSYDVYFAKWPRLTVISDTVHFSYIKHENPFDPYTVVDSLVYFRSTDRGLTWGLETALTYCPGAANQPITPVSCAGILSIFFEDDVGQGWPSNSLEIFQMLSTDGGRTWQRRAVAVHDSIHSQAPSAFAGGENRVILTWMDYKYGSGPDGFTGEIISKVSNDGGRSWGSESRVTTGPTADYSAPFIAEDIMGVAWLDRRFGSFQAKVYFSESDDGGVTWSQGIRLTNAQNDCAHPRFVVEGSRAVLSWEDARDGDNFQYEIYMRKYEIETDASEETESSSTSLEVNIYPNPFNNSTIINTNIGSDEFKSLEIFDITGRRVRNLLGEHKQMGTSDIVWKGTDDLGNKLSAGIYLVKINSSKGRVVRKAVLLK